MRMHEVTQERVVRCDMPKKNSNTKSANPRRPSGFRDRNMQSWSVSAMTFALDPEFVECARALVISTQSHSATHETTIIDTFNYKTKTCCTCRHAFTFKDPTVTQVVRKHFTNTFKDRGQSAQRP